MRTIIYMIVVMFACVVSITACKGNKSQQIYNRSDCNEPNGYEKLFHVVDGIMNVYYGGNQSDMISDNEEWKN